MFLTRHVKTFLGVSNNETLRNWVKEFQQYLSNQTNVGKGKSRSYTLEDLSVLKLVKNMRDQGFRFEDIHVSLANNQRSEIPEDLTAEQLEEAKDDPPRALLLQQMAVVRSERDSAIEALEQYQELKEDLIRKEAEIKFLKEHIEKLNSDLDALRKEGTTEAKKFGMQYARGYLDGSTGQSPEFDDE